MSRSYLRAPRLRTAESDQERSATWLELFYDLVFVVAVASLGRRLLDDVSWQGVLSYIGLFIPLWWAWAGFTFYADRFDTDDIGLRSLAVVQMVAIALMAASIGGGEADSTTAFALSFVLARVVLIVMYERARRNVPEARDLVTGYMIGLSVEAGFWLVSAFVPEPVRYYLWAAGLAVSFSAPFVLRKMQARVPLDTSHLPERFGLFTILVLGESIAAVVVGLSDQTWGFEATFAATVGVLIASSLWWLYFDNLEGSVVRRMPHQKKAWKPTAWIYSHLPLAMALVAAGVGVEFIVAHTEEALPAAERWLTVGGAAFALLAMAMIHVATVSPDPRRRDSLQARVRVASAAVLFVIAAAAGGLSSIPVAVLVLFVLVAQVVADVVIIEREAAPT